ncbi:MAG TPA: SpoIIE family protein phosphatase [Marinagarivorans sp.]
MNHVLSAKAAGKTVVLIDDDSATRERLAAHLRECELSVEEFDSALLARDFLLQNHPHVVITDLRLPELNGLDLLRFVNDLKTPMPVILMSGIGNVSDVAQALRLGAADYLIKPILDYDVVVHSVTRALNVLALQQENDAYKQRLEMMNRELKEHVQLLERDQQAAKQVQRNLLPVTPASYGGIELSHRVIPSLYLSGDFVDYGYLHRRYVAFYLTDVSGHGASSAFVTVWLKQLVRRLFRERQMFATDEGFNSAPAELLDVINRELMQSRFFSHLTCVVGVIDTETLEMCYVLAGHLPLPVIITPGGHAEYLEGKGKPVGLFEDASWQVNKVQLPEGFQLVMFSDGILETLPHGDLIDREKILLESMQGATRTLSLDEIARRLQLDCNQEAPDDIAMVLIKQLSV